MGREVAWSSPQTTSWTHLLQFREERGCAGCPQSAASPCCETQWARGSEAPRGTRCAPQEQETWWEGGFAAKCVQAWEQGSLYFALVHRSPTFMLRPCRSTYVFLSNLQSLNGTSDFCWLHICLVECPFISLPHLSCLQSVKNSEFLSSSNKMVHFAVSYSVGAEKIRWVLP